MRGVLILGLGCFILESAFLFETIGKKGCDKLFNLLFKKIFITPTPLDLFPGAFFESRIQG